MNFKFKENKMSWLRSRRIARLQLKIAGMEAKKEYLEITMGKLKTFSSCYIDTVAGLADHIARAKCILARLKE